MFGRGSWAILGLTKESLEDFRNILDDRSMMVAVSQLAASALTRQFASDTLGFNPFGAPRLDEEHILGPEQQEELARFSTLEQEARVEQGLSPEILDSAGYGAGSDRFRIHDSLPWYGFWAVTNEWKDVSDLASIKEQRSYALLERPYKFLQPTDRKTVDQEALAVTAPIRKQVPVLLDFNEGRVYVESSNKKLIYAIGVRLRQMGADVVPVAWSYPVANWTAVIASKLYQGTSFQSDFEKRADEATRFKPKEIEKLEDREMESIVANYFSMTELPSDLWVGISGPAQIRLHDASPAIGVKAPTSATTLLNMTNDATVISGSLTFQERITMESEAGGERSFRRDVLCVDINDKCNLSEAGAAMLRGFDAPAYRKDLQREIRKTREVPSIEQFWGSWLHELSNAVRTIEATFRDLLELDGDQPAGILPMHVAEPEAIPELVDA
jgi:hypothetical protein